MFFSWREQVFYKEESDLVNELLPGQGTECFKSSRMFSQLLQFKEYALTSDSPSKYFFFTDILLSLLT